MPFKLINRSLISFLLVLAFLFTYLFFWVGYLSVVVEYNSGYIIFLDEFRAEYETIVRFGFGICIAATLFLLVMASPNKLRLLMPSKKSLYILLSLGVSVVVNQQVPNKMFFFGILVNLLLLDALILRRQKLNIYYEVDQKVFKACLYFLISFLVIPFIIYYLHLLSTGNNYLKITLFPQLYLFDSFRGIALDRVQYGYLLGVLIILLLITNKKLAIILVPVSIMILFYVQSRTLLVSTSVALYILYGDTPRGRTLVVCTTMFLTFLYLLLGQRVGNFETGQRGIILHETFSKLYDGWIGFMLFGEGKLYALTAGGQQPHNTILQSIMDFGLIVTLLWLQYLWQVYTHLAKEAKVVFAYIMTFGLFHAGFSILVFIPITFLGYCLVLAVDIMYKNHGNLAINATRKLSS